MNNFLQIVMVVVRREVQLAMRSGGGWVQAVVFFGVFVVFMAFSFGPDQARLNTAAAPTIWLATLFAIQFAAAEMFIGDMDDGTLFVFAVENSSLGPYVTGKIISLILVVGGPLLLASPIVLTMFSIQASSFLLILPGLIIGTIALALATVIAGAINAALQGGGRFTTILAAPISVPVLIFGIASSNKAIDYGLLWSVEMQLLAAVTLFLLTIVPGFSILALRLGLE